MPRRGFYYEYGSIGGDDNADLHSPGTPHSNTFQIEGSPQGYEDLDPGHVTSSSGGGGGGGGGYRGRRYGGWVTWGIGLAAVATSLSAVFAVMHLVAFSLRQNQSHSLWLNEVEDSAIITGPSGQFAGVGTYSNTPGSNDGSGKRTATEHRPKIDIFSWDGEERKNQFMSSSYPAAPASHRSGSRDVNKQQEQSPTAEEAGEGVLTFVALNDYVRRGDIVGHGYPWLEGRVLVEPFRVTTLAVVDPVEGMEYEWSIVATHDPEDRLGDFTGRSVEVVFEVAPEYRVILVEKEHRRTAARAARATTTEERNEIARRTATVDVVSKYVRREIRALLDSEREELFDAMKVSRVVVGRVEEGWLGGNGGRTTPGQHCSNRTYEAS